MDKTKIIGNYIIEEEIGRGAFATVYKGFERYTGCCVAVKVIQREKLNRKLLDNLEMEISILQQSTHQNIVRLYDFKKSERHFYLIMEYCSGGDLSRLLRKRKILTEGDARFYLKQLTNGLKFMNEKKLIHRDLKPQNLLLSSCQNYGCLKIGDFGFAKHMQSVFDMAETLCGSPLYMAPEILKYERYDAKADLWSVGIILYEMLWGKPPFRAENHFELSRKMLENPTVKFPPFVQIVDKSKSHVSCQSQQRQAAVAVNSQSTIVPIQVSSDCKDLLRRLLKIDPTERISFEEFYQHPFFSGYIPTSLPVEIGSKLKAVSAGDSTRTIAHSIENNQLDAMLDAKCNVRDSFINKSSMTNDQVKDLHNEKKSGKNQFEDDLVIRLQSNSANSPLKFPTCHLQKENHDGQVNFLTKFNSLLICCKFANVILEIFNESNKMKFLIIALETLYEIANLLLSQFSYFIHMDHSYHDSADIEKLILWIIHFYSESIGIMELYYSQLLHSSNNTPRLCDNNGIYRDYFDHCIRLAKHGAVEETLGLSNSSLNLYHSSLFMMNSFFGEGDDGSFEIVKSICQRFIVAPGESIDCAQKILSLKHLLIRRIDSLKQTIL